MIALTVTPIYAAILALLLVYLAAKTIKLRWHHKVSLLDGGHEDLRRAIRVHGNFTEYVPLVLCLLAFSELNHAPAWALHTLGSALLLSRLLHAFALPDARSKIRKHGMLLTFFSLVGGSLRKSVV